MLNRVVREAKSTADKGLTFIPLEIATIHLRVYTNASFASNEDLTLQFGHLILLCDRNNTCNIMDFGSRESIRVVRSIVGGKLYAFTKAFDTSFTIAADVTRIFQRNISVRMYTDSKQVFDVITRGKRPAKKRLAIDVMSAREAYRGFGIDRVGIIRGEHSPADALSKIKHNSVLREIITKNRDSILVQEQIHRVYPSNKDSTASLTN